MPLPWLTTSARRELSFEYIQAIMPSILGSVERAREHCAPENEERERDPYPQRGIRTPRGSRRFLLFIFFLLLPEDEEEGTRTIHLRHAAHSASVSGRSSRTSPPAASPPLSSSPHTPSGSKSSGGRTSPYGGAVSTSNGVERRGQGTAT